MESFITKMLYWSTTFGVALPGNAGQASGTSSTLRNTKDNIHESKIHNNIYTIEKTELDLYEFMKNNNLSLSSFYTNYEKELSFFNEEDYTSITLKCIIYQHNNYYFYILGKHKYRGELIAKMGFVDGKMCDNIHQTSNSLEELSMTYNFDFNNIL